MKGVIIFVLILGSTIALTGCQLARPMQLATGQMVNFIRPDVLMAPAAAPLQPTPMPTARLVMPNAATPNGPYAALSEEELAADIDQALTAAIAATAAAFASVNTAAVDKLVSPTEYDMAVAGVNTALGAIFAAESAIMAYSDLYGALSTSPQSELLIIEQGLQGIEAPLTSLNGTLALIGFSAQPQMTLTTETLQQIDSAAKQARAAVAVVQPKMQVWLMSVKANLDRRVGCIRATEPTAIADTTIGALQNANRFFASARSILADQKVTPNELVRVAVDSANAVASLKAVGGSELEKLANSIATMTNQLARGQLPQVQLTLSGF